MVTVIPVFGVLISLVLAAQYDLKVYLVFGAGTILGISAYVFTGRNTERRSINIER